VLSSVGAVCCECKQLSCIVRSAWPASSRLPATCCSCVQLRPSQVLPVEVLPVTNIMCMRAVSPHLSQLSEVRERLQQLTEGNRLLAQQVAAATACCPGPLPALPPITSPTSEASCSMECRGSSQHPRGVVSHQRHHSWAGAPMQGSSSSSGGVAVGAVGVLPAGHSRSLSHGAPAAGMAGPWSHMAVPPAAVPGGGSMGPGGGSWAAADWAAAAGPRGPPLPLPAAHGQVDVLGRGSAPVATPQQQQQQQQQQGVPPGQKQGRTGCAIPVVHEPTAAEVNELMQGSPRFSGSLGTGPLEELLVLSPGSSTMEWAAEGVLAAGPLAAAAGGAKAAVTAPLAGSGQDLGSEADAMEVIYSGQPVGVLRHPSEVAGAATAAGGAAAAAGVPALSLQQPCGALHCTHAPGPMGGTSQQGGPLSLHGYSMASPAAVAGGAAGHMGPPAPPGSSCGGMPGTGQGVSAACAQPQQLGWGGCTPRQLQHAHSWPNAMWDQQRQQEEQGQPCSGSPVAPAGQPPALAGASGGVPSPPWGTSGRSTPHTPPSVGSPGCLSPAALRRSMSYPAPGDSLAVGGRLPTAQLTPGRGPVGGSYPGTPPAGAAGPGMLSPGLLPPGGLPWRPPPLSPAAGGSGSGWGTGGCSPVSPGVAVLRGMPLGGDAAAGSSCGGNPLRPRLPLGGLTGGNIPPSLPAGVPGNTHPGAHHQRCMSLDAGMPGQGVTFTLGANPAAPWARGPAGPTHRRCGSSGSMLPEGRAPWAEGPAGGVASPRGLQPPPLLLPGAGGGPGFGAGRLAGPMVHPHPPHPGMGGLQGPGSLPGVPVAGLGPVTLSSPAPPLPGSAGPYMQPVALGSSGPVLG
jgi:hypothetical protein